MHIFSGTQNRITWGLIVFNQLNAHDQIKMWNIFDEVFKEMLLEIIRETWKLNIFFDMVITLPLFFLMNQAYKDWIIKAIR